MFRANWRYDMTIIGGILFLGIFVWMGSRNPDESGPLSIKGYGGELSHNVVKILERMNEDLKTSKGIISAKPNRIVIIDGNNDVKEYSFAYETLWCNNSPVVSSVRAFHFEYRDGSGNLLNRTEKYLSVVETVGYTIRIWLDDKDVLTSSKVRIPAFGRDDNVENPDPVEWETALNY